MLFSEIPSNIWCFILAVIFLLPGLFVLLYPHSSAKALTAFPRNVPAGIVLSTLAMLWSGALLYFFPLDFLASIRKFIPLIFIVSIPLCWIWMKDLLAARALGGLMSLLPAPVFLAVRFCDSAWRLVVVVLMYVFVIVGIFVILYPYLVRDAFAWSVKNPDRLRGCGIVFVVLGLLLALIGGFAL